MVSITYHNFDYVYHRLLRFVNDYGEFTGRARKVDFKETLCASFELTDPTNNTINNVIRNVNTDYAKAFAEYCINGGENLQELIRLNPKAHRYVSDKHVKGMVVNYGARIAQQLPAILNLLTADPNSRRAIIHILHPEDWIIAHTPNATLEFPCASTLHFFIRNNQLHLMVNMRSQHIALVINYDVYNFTTLQMHVANLLKLAPGSYYHQMNSAHFFMKEQELVDDILAEYNVKP